MASLTWHQIQAQRRAYRLRRHAAHILSDSFITTGKALCGAVDPKVTLDAEHRHRVENGACKRCAAMADRMGL